MLNNSRAKSSPRGRRGRRPGASPDTRAAVIAAARAQFAERGYARTTFRSVASAAGVDAALLVHFHGSKAGLFRDALALPRAPAPVIEELLAGPRRTLGKRLMRSMLAFLADDDTRETLLGRVRCATSEPEAAALVREIIADDVVGPVTRALGVDQPERRAALVSTQLIGWVIADWILEIEALRSMSDEEAVAALGPVLQRYLLKPLV